MEYDFKSTEAKWQKYWAENKTFHAKQAEDRPKYYVLDMFPYPSGAGLHVGHPLGYIASDIHARYKRLKGFNVLHPMGYDSFGLPAEQYAIQTGQHPAVTTEVNINRYREQLDKIGFSFDWSREIRTSDPAYYKWTQWIFLQLFDAWYSKDLNKAVPIKDLIDTFVIQGNKGVDAVCAEGTPQFSAEEWKEMSKNERQDILLNYRLAYLSESEVNWCPALGTVLANDEVKDGVSERGGHPVVQKKMMQWSMRITAYAERLLTGLDPLDWSDAIKELQRNWIGKSEGASVFFGVKDNDAKIEVFTTRPDTIFGVSFMVLAPEHKLVETITTAEHKAEVEAYIERTKKRTERERLAEVKNITGAFTGAYAIHPFTGAPVPIWIGDYVLAGYGTGAVMAVPSGDQRDWDFANHFNLPIPNVIEGADVSESASESKEGKLCNSEFLNGLPVKEAIKKAIDAIEERQIGTRKVNYKLRDAVFGRQRYWGEPIPIYYKNGIPKAVKTEHLPLELPEVDKFLPTEDGEPPLQRATTWNYDPEKGVVANGEGFPLETTTMPGWAGSSWYYLRYEDPNNTNAFADESAVNYWKNVDFYLGGSEHATGHLLYVRFWTKFLFDMGYIPFDEPAQKLVNQGMIQGVSKFVYRVEGTNQFVSKGLRKEYKTSAIHADVSFVNEHNELDIDAFKAWREDFKGAEFILEGGKYICGNEVEKMSKSKFNVVNPDELIEQYSADALRLHEMFLGPIEMHKPWNTQGIDGVTKFIRKLWRLFHSGENESFVVSEEAPTKAELKALHTAIQKVTSDMERLAFNTSVSNFMVAVNEFTSLKSNKRSILEPLTILLSCHAPHVAEELWSLLGHETSIVEAQWPEFDEKHLAEDEFNYPVSFNGKMRFTLPLSAGLSKDEIQDAVMSDERTQKYLDGKTPKKVIIVPKKIVNFVV
ncbi:MAG: leucine--tRNA ligase [Crocinitomicaceae bacterium]|nr:leucine--tRNA ligase [Crocinitomicaceae bacterium]|tara:strand:- start:13105 stop:15903 length:2799 start_codon:yes stop_codon:yes gene_type:complete